MKNLKPIVKPCDSRPKDDAPEEVDCAFVSIDGELEGQTTCVLNLIIILAIGPYCAT